MHAIEGEFGKAKVEVMATRLTKINPKIQITGFDEFLESDNLERIIPMGAYVLDASDSVKAKIALAAWCTSHNQALVMCGATGGKTNPSLVCCDDLSKTEQDALLAKVRVGLRTDYGFSRDLKKKMGVRAVYSREPRSGTANGGLACSGYGSTVMVTATSGFIAASEILNLIAA